MAEPLTAVVTGAGSGIGRAVALALAARGIGVIASDLVLAAADATSAAAAAAPGAMTPHHGDVTDDAAMAALAAAAIERFGSLDIAINCAGGGNRFGPLAELDGDDFDFMLAVNLKGVFLAMRHQLPHMVARGGGAIVNISSTAGIRGVAGSALYAAAKHGVIGLTKSAALDYAGQGVRVNAICPGAIATPQFERVISRRFPDRPLAAAIDAVGQSIPLGRVGTPDDVAQLALWLSSDDARYVTGQAYVLDGGATIR